MDDDLLGSLLPLAAAGSEVRPAMVADGSAPEYAQDLLDPFIASTAASVYAVQAAAQVADNKMTQRLRHTLKSSCAGVGALPLAKLAAAGETGLHQGHEPAADLPARLLHSFEAFEAATSAHV